MAARLRCDRQIDIIPFLYVITGFDFPWAAHHWFPFGIYGGAPKHDMHHYKPLTNFQPYFNTWDKLFGTWCPPMSAGGFKSEKLLNFEAKKREERKKNFKNGIY